MAEWYGMNSSRLSLSECWHLSRPRGARVGNPAWLLMLSPANAKPSAIPRDFLFTFMSPPMIFFSPGLLAALSSSFVGLALRV